MQMGHGSLINREVGLDFFTKRQSSRNERGPVQCTSSSSFYLHAFADVTLAEASSWPSVA